MMEALMHFGGELLGGGSTAMLAATALVLFVTAVAARLTWRRMHYDIHKIPIGPQAVPILGHLLLYWRHHDFTSMFLKLHEITKQPVLRILVPHKDVIIVADPAIAAKVYARTGPESIPRKVPEYSSFDAATGLHGHHSILTEQREEMWIAVRKALSPAYTLAANKQNYTAVLNAYADVGRRINGALAAAAAAATANPQQQEQLMEGASKASAGGAEAVPSVRVMDVGLLAGQDASDSSSQGSRRGSDDGREDGAVAAAAGAAVAADVEVDHHLLGAAIQMQVEGLFEMKDHNIDYLEVAHDLEEAIGIVHNYTAQPWLKPFHLLAPWATEEARRLRSARLRLSRKCYEPIFKHVQTCENPSDLSLTMCLRKLVDPATGKPPPQERLLAEVGNQIMAPETAAHTVSWVLYCLATHPEAEAKLMAELRQAGLPCNGDLEAAVQVLESGFDPLKGLPFLEAVMHEAMRLYPAGASASARLTEKPTRVGPYLIPAGVTVFPSLFLINNWSGTWGPDAREFRPERFLEADATIDKASGAPRFLPFGSGPKNCIGLALGQVAVRSAVGLLMSTFRFTSAARMGSHEEVMARTMLALTLKVKNGMWLNATRRSA